MASPTMLTKIMSMFRRPRVAPAKIDSDEAVPIPFFDDTFLFKTFVLHSMFVFDDVLDVQKLGDALETLAQRDGWRKLAARLRKNASGNIEYRIPTHFPPGRPAITKSHTHHDTTLAEDPAGRHIPTPTARPAVIPGNAALFSALYLGADAPARMDDYLSADRSVLGMRTVSFRDATVVVLSWPHAAFDATAKRDLLAAWELVLRGRGHEVREPCDFRADPLAALGGNNVRRGGAQSHVLAGRKLGVLGVLGWAMRNLADLVFRAQETRVVCLPAGFVEGLRAVAVKELDVSAGGCGGGDGGDGERPFVSEGDVLVAWLARLAVSHLPRCSTRTVAIQNVFSGRKVLTGSLLPPDRPFISNCVYFFNTLLPTCDILAKPLSHTAQQIRWALREQSTREQIEAYCAILRESGSGKFPPFFGDSAMHLISVTNWSKADFFGVDFSAASVSGSGRPVRPRYIHSAQTPYKFTEMFPIIGKDAHGNYWFSATRLTCNWVAVEKALDRGDYLFRKDFIGM